MSEPQLKRIIDLARDGEDRRMLTPRFIEQLSRLVDNPEQPAVRELTFLSDLSRVERDELAARWGQIPITTRRRIVSSLVTIAEDNVEYDFDHMYLQAISDPDATVRKSAAEGLWESESGTAMNRLLERVADDEDATVRVAAAISLGHFVYLAETGKLRAEAVARLRSTLLAVYADLNLPAEVRRRAVEAVAYLSDDGDVLAAISDAYADTEDKMRASAVHAMGRNMDSRWLDTVLGEMSNPTAEMRYEAARAAGEMSDNRATAPLVKLLADEDTEVRLMTIWALGQIAGPVATNALKRVAQSGDKLMRDAAADALAEARLNDNPMGII